MENNLTLEIIAEKLGGKVWQKNDIKRVYLDRGHNTKKMSTKTYVYQREDGTFGVSCYIECDSQPLAWIKSQQQEVIKDVMQDINNIIERSQIMLVKYKVLEDKPEVMVYVKKNENAEPIWYTEQDFFNEFSEYPENIFENIPVVTKQ